MKDFYTRFFAAIEHSPAHHEFCERVYGMDLGQHGFADIEQLELLKRATRMGPSHNVLDRGCGNGLIAEYLSDTTGAQVTGLDYIEPAILAARRRTAAKSDRLSFISGDINRLGLPQGSFHILLFYSTL